MLEVGAGCGLISAVVNKSNIGITFEASDPVSYSFCDLMGSFCIIKRKSFKDIKSSEPIFISWLHQSCQEEFLSMIKRNKPKFIIHIGEGPIIDTRVPDGNCYDKTFLKKMENLGYKYVILPVKLLCHVDYYKDDQLRKSYGRDYGRSCLTLLYPIDDNTDFIKICGEENLHEYVGINVPYLFQDKEILTLKNNVKSDVAYKLAMNNYLKYNSK